MNGVEYIQLKRENQKTIHRYTDDVDDKNTDKELVFAAAAYLLSGSMTINGNDIAKNIWPFGWTHFKQDSEIEMLANAGALIAAEIDRLQRQKEKL